MTEPARPELSALDEEQRRRVRKVLAARKAACGSCRNTEFEVGEALYLGFLFRQEDLDAYLVALTCTNPECTAPRTGVRLHESEFHTAETGRG